jgi:hypothetical protein
MISVGAWFAEELAGVALTEEVTGELGTSMMSVGRWESELAEALLLGLGLEV